ncbi:hypothetical protein E4K67_22340 [Desulfosporosinus fructosivorans]|uniref:Uncharacterized protein n=1 Tax=Desulfosporosinus fructosivorans TaxID=2018669 RepID=A0A4Z0QZI3_9FIRM|nr:hypothetical protein [Desulfosporosinus fructosivorans]TGE35860.1 hypothetical protein E4K67_22340 [Desulfosporosinus fructosivorans]
MVMKRQNITLDPVVYKCFSEIAEKKGIQTSTWVNAKMKSFIEEEGGNMTPFDLAKENDTIYGCHIDGVCGTEMQDFCEELKLLLLKYGITNIQTSLSTLAQISIIEGNLLVLGTVIKGSGEITNPKDEGYDNIKLAKEYGLDA